MDELVKEMNVPEKELEGYNASINQLIKSLKNLKSKQNLKVNFLIIKFSYF